MDYLVIMRLKVVHEPFQLLNLCFFDEVVTTQNTAYLNCLKIIP